MREIKTEIETNNLLFLFFSLFLEDLESHIAARLNIDP